jgi:hypothetical protein
MCNLGCHVRDTPLCFVELLGSSSETPMITGEEGEVGAREAQI